MAMDKVTTANACARLVVEQVEIDGHPLERMQRDCLHEAVRALVYGFLHWQQGRR